MNTKTLIMIAAAWVFGLVGFSFYYANSNDFIGYESTSFVPCDVELEEGESFSMVTHSVKDCKNLTSS